MSIDIITFFYLKEKNSTVERQKNYEIYNNKGISSIYAKINNNCIKLI